jgi:hypothetical protein
MPIEIRELVIRASIRDESEKSKADSMAPSASSGTEASREEQLVNRCVEQVMEILKIKNER